jgi:hypothetical protein
MKEVAYSNMIVTGCEDLFQQEVCGASRNTTIIGQLN